MFERVSLSLKSYKIPVQIRIGHVHLKVSDISKGLYQEMLGFEIKQRYGTQVYPQADITTILG